MARINRSDVIQKAVNDLAISTSTEKVPNETLDKVQLTYDLNKKFSSFISNASTVTTGTLTAILPTIDPRSEIYITSIDFHTIKDATCDIATGQVGVSLTTDLQGIAKPIIQIGVITLTAQSEHVTLNLQYPIKVKANTNITINGSYTVGLLYRTVSVTGFYISTN